MTTDPVPTPPPQASAPFGQWHGGQVTERALCVLCPNPSPMTLDGTNTWVLLEPTATDAVVIDPGPLDEGHLRAVVAAVEARGARVAQTVLTHGHPDHAEGAERFAELTGAPTRAVGRGHDDLGDGDVVRTGGLELRVVATPGHTSDSSPPSHAFIVAVSSQSWRMTIMRTKTSIPLMMMVR